MLQREYNFKKKKKKDLLTVVSALQMKVPSGWHASEGVERMAFQKIAYNAIPFRLANNLQCLECFAPKNKRFLCYSNAQKAASAQCLKETPVAGSGERLTCIMFSRKRMSLSKTVTLAPCCHQAQNTYPHKTAQVQERDMELQGSLTPPCS